MDQLLLLIAFALTAVPVGGLLLDRLFDVPARRYFALLGAPWIIGVLVVIASSPLSPIGPLVLWGAVGGILGTVALDAVRLVGVRAGAFPLDMPKMFGILLAGLAPVLQRNIIARMVEVTAGLPDDDRRRALAPRIAAMARLSERRRSIVAAGMFAGLSRLPEDLRQAMLSTQLGLLATGPAETRKAVMGTMTRAMSGSLVVPYGQPRGMPRVPMATFRSLADVALARTVEEAGVTWRRIHLYGYGWHVVMGAAFGAQYTLLVGAGSLPLAILWGTFVWLAMMVVMPPMMPMVRFPAWFPVVPFVAHIAFVLPIAWVALALLPSAATAGSLLGLLGSP